jgi:hypothetical protein
MKTSTSSGGGPCLSRPDAGSRLSRVHSLQARIQRAAAESGVKHVSLELAGKNAMLVFPDADLEKAAVGAVMGMNPTWSGWSCGRGHGFSCTSP